MWWKNLKMMIILGVVVTVILGAIILALVLKFGGGGGGGDDKTTMHPSSISPASSSRPNQVVKRIFRRTFNGQEAYNNEQQLQQR